jgi:eukaryotic-like serine/threonine-protein kinase
MPRCPTCHRRAASGACKFDGARIESTPFDVAGPEPELSGLTNARSVASGGFSVVWRGVDHAARDVALKVGRGISSDVQRRFEREAASLRQLGSPTVPHLYEQGRLADGRPFLVLEWLPAPTLASWLERRGELPRFRDIQRIARAVVACLERVTTAGILHRDIKPENLILFEHGRGHHDELPSVVVLDFGGAKSSRSSAELEPNVAAASDVTEASLLVGTNEYLAPERILGGDAGEAAEVYALGVVLYEITTLRLPFVSRGRAVLHEHLALVPSLPERSADVPAQWDRLLLDCLAKDPSRRPATVTELRQRLVDCSTVPRALVSRGTARTTATAQDGAQLAAILLLDGAHEIIPLVGVIAAFRGFVARIQGQRVIAVFCAADCDAPLEAALEASVELVTSLRAVRVGLHLDLVELGHALDGAPTARGAAIDRPELWFATSEGKPRAVVSQAACDALSESRLHRLHAAVGHVSTPATNDLHRSASGPSPPLPLLDRDALVAAIDASLETWRQDREPVVLVLVGERGAGKTRMAEEIMERARGAAGTQAILLAGRPGRSVVRARDLETACRQASSLPTEASGLTAVLRALAMRAPLALVIDDAELAEDELLDAVEAALLEPPALPIWVACVGEDRFAKTRPLWGTRVHDFCKLRLKPLSLAASKALASELLRPAEYVPDEALTTIGTAAAQLPAPLFELVRQIRRAGLIKRRSTRNSYFLDTAELARVPVPALWHWLAARELGALEPALASGARLVTVLGSGLSHRELEAVQLGLRLEGAPYAALDSGVLLERLVGCGLLVTAPNAADRYAFRVPAMADALASLVEPTERERIHRLALAHYEAPDSELPRQLQQIARHATALGRSATASAAHRELAELAANAQRVVDAETHYTAALAQSDVPPERGRLLLGRARVYCRLYRLDEALRDLAEALDISEKHRDFALAAQAHFELATVRDWNGEYSASAVAAQLGVEIESTRLLTTRSPRGLVALGRSAWRRGEVSSAIALLTRGAAACEEQGEVESKIVARLLLGCALVQAGRRSDASVCFEQVIADAEASHDGLHLCAALGNRAFLWAVEGDAERCACDLARAVAVARRLGHPATERTALVNLSEVLYWAGREDEASVWLRQARLLEERFIQHPLHSAVLLQARIALLTDRVQDATAALVWLAERELPKPESTNAVAFQSALLLTLQAEATTARPLLPIALAWPEIAELSDGFLNAERAELRYWHFRSRWPADSESAQRLLLEEAASSFIDQPVWLQRLLRLPRYGSSVNSGSRF